ncbi:MAG: hypothetical protein KGK12_02320, partial [Armatimonadetes bacterium]|nr:hypothetical protein [Armatimonadota bacterium]
MTSPELAARRRPTERAAAFAIGAGALAITLLPYVQGWAGAHGRVYMWLGYNLDDSCVYLSWMHQAAHSGLRVYNLFTTDAQHGLIANPLFLALGWFGAVTHMPLVAVNQLARLAGGVVLLAVVWRLLKATILEPRSRLMAFALICFSSGLGWLPLWWSVPPIATPIDKWQPEAITFLSLYLSALFAFSIAMQAAVIGLLYGAMQRRDWRLATGAGLLGAVIGLTHSYDVITISAVWLSFLVVETAAAVAGHSTEARRKALAGWLHAGIAGALTLPSVAVMYHEFRTEAVFHARAEVPTLAPALAWVVLGYGITLALAIGGAIVIWQRGGFGVAPGASAPRDHDPFFRTNTAARLMLVWAVVNVAIAWMPGAAFQRKLIQGAHLPLAVLAAGGALAFWRWLSRRTPGTSYSLFTVSLTIVLALTNIRFLVREVRNNERNRVQTMLERAYLNPGELAALQWIARHTPKRDAVQPLPWVMQPDPHHIAAYDITLA